MCELHERRQWGGPGERGVQQRERDHEHDARSGRKTGAPCFFLGRLEGWASWGGTRAAVLGAHAFGPKVLGWGFLEVSWVEELKGGPCGSMCGRSVRPFVPKDPGQNSRLIVAA